MASKKELERRIEALELQVMKQSVNKYFMLNSWKEPTLKANVEAIMKHLGITVHINSAEERVVVKKNSKKGKK